MADNVTWQTATLATPASGTVAATDEVAVGGTQPVAQVQFVKLVDGTLNGTDALPGTAANGLDVDVTRVSGTVTVDGSGVTQPISAASLPLPTGASTLAEQQTQTTALQLIDDLPHAGAAAINKYAVMGGQLDDAAPTTPAEDQVAPLRITSARALHTSLQTAIPAFQP